MKILKLAVLTAISLSSFAALRAQTVDEIMDKHLKAIGSKEAWESLKTMKLDGSMSVQGMDIGITQTMALGKAMRTDISVMGMNGYTIVTKTQGWMYMPFQGQTKVDTMKPDMVKMAQSQLDIGSKGMFDYKTIGKKTEFLGKDTLNKVVCYKIRFTDKDGNESVSYFDVNTYYILRTETKVKQDEQEQEVAMGYDNYKKLDGGIVMPMTMSTPQGDINFKTIEINKPIADDVFVPTDPKAASKDAGPKK